LDVCRGARLRRILDADLSETINLALREKDLADRLSALLQKARSGQRFREE